MRPRECPTYIDTQAILELWGCRCAYCGESLSQGEHALDHITPHIRGGRLTVANVALSCIPCNSTKHDRTAEELGRPDVRQRAEEIAARCSDLSAAGVLGRDPSVKERFNRQFPSALFEAGG